MGEPRDTLPTFFRNAAAFRRWLRANHKKAQVLLVGFHRKDSGRPSMTWPESVDEALCYGWIDGVRNRLDETRYTIRFTPRRKTSRWSAINLERVRVLTAEGRMTAAGLSIHSERKEPGHAGYSYSLREVGPLTPARLRRFKREKAAWAFFSTQAPSYQKLARHWLESAKQEETRTRRFERVLAASKAGKRI